MMEAVDSPMDGRGNKEVKITKKLDNGMTKEMCVREIANGFIITKRIYGDDPKTGKWYNQEKEYYSAVNPAKDEEFSAKVEMKGLLNSINHI